MIINNSKKFIFIHIPKSAGTSVSNFLRQYNTLADIDLSFPKAHKIHGAINSYYRKKHGLIKHSTYEKLSHLIGQDMIQTYFRITFVRNPYSRALSAYNYTLQTKSKDERFQKNYGHLDFNDFMHSDYLIKNDLMQFRPQMHWIDHVNNFDYIGRVETIAKDLADISKTIEKKKSSTKIRAPRKNASRLKKADWRAMTEETSALIRKLYKDDFEALKYSYEIDSLSSRDDT